MLFSLILQITSYCLILPHYAILFRLSYSAYEISDVLFGIRQFAIFCENFHQSSFITSSYSQFLIVFCDGMVVSLPYYLSETRF